MVALVETATLRGVEAKSVQVEAELTQGLPQFTIIGLGDTAVQEARFRISAAVRASGIELPQKRVTINLAPAGFRKDGSALDLPMAIGVLVAAGVLPASAVEDHLIVGELALSGRLRPVRGVLSVAALAKKQGVSKIIVPRENGHEAQALPEVEAVACESLAEVVAVLKGEQAATPVAAKTVLRSDDGVDLAEVRGQALARRALEIAAAGGHNLLLVGTPGSGKTMLARRLPTILPKLSPDECIEVTTVRSAAGLTLSGSPLDSRRPFRAPHHSASAVGLVGGGSPIRPGEISLAHRGVLFIDEMAEVPRRVLESLRQPLEDRAVVVTRARYSVRLPASFMLVGAANPCPCGWLGHETDRCTCRPDEIRRYAGRLSGPLLDRMDLRVEMPALPREDLFALDPAESSAAVRARVAAARDLAFKRQGASNAELAGKKVRRQLMDKAARQLLEAAVDRFDLSARGLERTLRVARTVADLEAAPELNADHVAEALGYREPRAWAGPVD